MSTDRELFEAVEGIEPVEPEPMLGDSDGAIEVNWSAVDDSIDRMLNADFAKTIFSVKTLAELRDMANKLEPEDYALFHFAITQQTTHLKAVAKFDADRKAAFAAERKAHRPQPQPVKVAVAVATARIPKEVVMQFQNNAHKLCRVHVSRVNALTSLGWQIIQGVSK